LEPYLSNSHCQNQQYCFDIEEVNLILLDDVIYFGLITTVRTAERIHIQLKNNGGEGRVVIETQ